MFIEMHNKEFTLITSPLKFNLPNNKKKLIFLGEWHSIDKKVNNRYKNNFKVISSPWRQLKKRKKDFIYLTKAYEKMLSALYTSLNKIHNMNYSKKYWEQVIGIWLIEYLISVFEKYLIVKKLKNDRKYKVYSPEHGDFMLPKNSREAKKLFLSDEWSHFIYITLIKELKKKIKIKKVLKTSTNKDFFMSLKPNRFNIKIFLINLFSKLSNFIKTKEKIFIITTYLNIFNELRLQVKTNKILKINLPSENEFKFRKTINETFRNYVPKIVKTDDDFIKFIKKNIFKNIPSLYLEEYKEAKKFKNYMRFSDNPKKIFTNGSNFYDDLFKIWLAGKKENGAKLIYGQHGTEYVSKFCSYDFYSKKTSDYILTWGKKIGQQKKFITFANIKTISKDINIKKTNNITLMQQFPTKYNTRLWTGLNLCDYERYISRQDIFLRNLKRDIYKNITVRLGSNLSHTSVNNFINFEKDIWLKLQPNIKLETRDKNIHETLKQSYLTIFTTATATLLFECVSLNIPFLIFSPEYKEETSRELATNLSILKRNKILFQDPKKMAKFLNTKNYQEINSWWYSSKTQKIIKNFQINFARTSNKPLEELKAILSSTKKKNEYIRREF